MDNKLEKPRRSSLQVNLSYLTNSPDSFEESLNDLSPSINNKPKRRTSLNSEIPQRILPRIISIETRPANNSETFSKDQLLNENCLQLRTEILRKTKEIYNNSELMTKTEQVLQEKQTNREKLENSYGKSNSNKNQKSPSIKIVLNEDEQLTMSATKNTENLLSVKIMKSPLTTKKMETPKSSRITQVSSKLNSENNNFPRKRLFDGLANLSTSPILSGATSKKRAKCALENLKNNSLKCSSFKNNGNDDNYDSMEMTTISSHLPIGTRRSFEETGKCSQDKRVISMELTEIKGKILSTPWKKSNSNSNSNDSMTNRTSLNVNTSLDQSSQRPESKNNQQSSSFEQERNESFETANNDSGDEKNSPFSEMGNEKREKSEEGEKREKNEEREKRENREKSEEREKNEQSEEKLRGRRVRKFTLSLNCREKNVGKKTIIEEEKSQCSPTGSKNENNEEENVIARRKKLFNSEDSKLNRSVVILEGNNDSFEGKEDFLKPRSERRTRRSTVMEIGETSRVEATPYPISRSYMWKSQIKQNTIESNSNASLDRSVLSIDEEVTRKRRKNSKEKHPALDSSDSETESQKRNTSKESLRRRVSETSSKSSLRNTLNESTTSSTSSSLSSKIKKKKLYPIRGNSGLLSMSPMNTPTPKAKIIKKHRKNVKWQKMKETQRTQRLERTQLKVTDTDESNTEDLEEEENIVQVPKKPKRTRKVVSKEIIFKKKLPIDVAHKGRKLLENNRKRRGRNFINKNCEFSESRRSSMTDFEPVEEKAKRKKNSKRVHIVTTGFSNGDKGKVKNVVKELGKAEMESNVTRKTTHVISTGVRTINLLKGILRGCWLVSLEWVLKSQSAGKWINPEPFELAHFSESVKENRRERQIFGNAYVPELFLNCGLIHVNGGTNPEPPILKDLIKLAGGQITENPKEAKIKIGSNGLREIWILDSITSGKIQPEKQYRQRT